MREDFQLALPPARLVAAAAQGGAEAALDAGEHALDLPALAVAAAGGAAAHPAVGAGGEAGAHRPAVALPGPLAGAAGVEGDDGGAAARALAGQPVVGLRVV